MRLRALYPCLSLTLLAACASVPDLTEKPVGVAGVAIYLPAPEGLVGVSADTPSRRPRNAELQANGLRPLRHFLVPDDARRAQNGLPLNSAHEAYAVTPLGLENHGAVSAPDLARLQATVRKQIAEFEPAPVEPDETLREAWDEQVDANLSTESVNLRILSMEVTGDGDDHICTLHRSEQETTVGAIGYYSFFEYYDHGIFDWQTCWLLVNRRLIRLTLSDEANDDSRERIIGTMTAWLDAIRQANHARDAEPYPAQALASNQRPSAPRGATDPNHKGRL